MKGAQQAEDYRRPREVDAQVVLQQVILPVDSVWCPIDPWCWVDVPVKSQLVMKCPNARVGVVLGAGNLRYNACMASPWLRLSQGLGTKVLPIR